MADLKKTNIDKKILQSLDLVYVMPNKNEIDIKKILIRKGRNIIVPNLEEIFIFGALLFPKDPSNVLIYPHPIFSVKEVLKKPGIGRESWDYQGLSYEILEGNTLTISEAPWESEITLFENGKASAFIGCGTDVEACIFPTPVQFNPDKHLVAVKSPNGTRTFNNSLFTIETKLDRIAYLDAPCHIVYTSLAELQTGRWAKKRFYGSPTIEDNPHLL